MGRVLSGRYLLGSRIGGGGMGAVFEARDEALQRQVAVKVVPGTQAADPGFLREARALSRLRHPGIVQLFDAGTDDGDGYLVLELVAGQTLGDLLRRGPLQPAHVQRIGRQLAEALAHAHAVGVVHRDVSPANVLVDDDGCVRLTDFGIARLTEATATVGGEVWGTPAFIAPEQVAGERVGPPADVYALGLVLLEALTGVRAFPGTARESTIARLHRDPVVPGELPQPWPRLLRQMTAREPMARPGAATVAAQLGAADGVVRTMALPMGASAAASAPASPASGSPRESAGRVAAPVAWWRQPVAALAGLLLLSALLLGLALRADGPAVDGALEPATAATTPAPPPPEEVREDDDQDGGGKGGKGRGKGKND